MTITVNDLKGYHTTKGPVIGSPHAIALHQKKIREEDYTLYFINIFQYDISYLPIDCHDRYRFNCEVTLQLTDTFIRIVIPVGDYSTIEDLERSIYDMYRKLGAKPNN